MKVTLLMAQTLDGRIAKDSDHFPDWTEKADKKFFMNYTKEAGVMIMGRKTFDTLPGVLPGRLSVVLSRSAEEWEAREENLVFTSLSPQDILAKLVSLGNDHVVLTGGTTINSLFAEEGLIDEIIVTVSPVVFGEGLGVFAPEISLDLTLEKSEPLGDNSRTLYYKVNK
jgi:dihydrofolate reductase